MNLFAALRITSFSLLIAAGAIVPVAAQTEPQEMSVEELEKYIEEQKAALAEVEANREETIAQARKVEDELAAQQKRSERVREELEALCAEQEAIAAGTLEACTAQLDS